MVKRMLFRIDYSVCDYDYKFKIKVSRPLLMSRRRLERKFQGLLQHFPNFSVYWEDEWTYIINLYFDGSVGYISFKWTEDR